MKNRRKLNIILIIFLIVLALGLGYAYLTTTLSINGTTDVDSNTWNVYWDNVQVTEGSVTATTPTIDTNKTTVSFSVHLSKPGDFYEFTVDAKNAGTIDAMIETINSTINGNPISELPVYLSYSLTYSDDIEVEENHLLEANKSEKYKIKIEYRTDINPSDLPSSTQVLNMGFGMNYIQKNSTATPVRTTVYYVNENTLTLGTPIPNGTTTYNNYQSAIKKYDKPFFLKLSVPNNIITEAYVGFIYNNNVYYLQGGVNESALSSKPVYESNKEILINAFGTEKCTNNNTRFSCSDSTPYIDVVAYNNGLVSAQGVGILCSITSNGGSFCDGNYSY